MLNAIKNVINNGGYNLESVLYKINKMYIENRLSEEQKTELDNLAREKAKPKDSYDMQKQIDELRARVEILEKNKETEEPTTEPSEPVEEYLPFKQPTGAHDCYKIGDKIIFNGKKYICILDNCVWSPETYPQSWEEVVEATENNVVEEA